MAVKGVKDVMNKAKVMTATATLVAGLGVVSHVNADEVDFSTATQNPEAQTNQTENNVTKADVNAAKADLDTANQAVSHQEQVVSDAATAADEAQSTYNQAQQSTNEAQNLVDQATPENIASAQDDVNSAQEQVSQADNAERVAENTVAQAQEAVNKQTEIVNSAQTAVDEANQTVTSSKSDLAAKTAKANQTEQALKNAEAAYKVAENDYKAINTITLSQAYVEALKKYNDYSLSAEERQQILKTLAEESEALAKVNTYKSNPNDDNSTKYQINDLPEDVIKELSLFAADLVNQIRLAFGSPQVTVTESSVKFVDLVTDGYVSDRWNVTEAMKQGQIGHDAKAVNNAAQYFGLPTSPADEEAEGSQYYEDWASSQVYDGITFATLKQRVYQAVTDFMFNADEWRHARDIVGGGDINSQVYFAIDFSRPSTENGAFAGVHFISISEDQASRSSYFDTTAFINPKSAENVTATYNAAKSALAKAQADNNVAQEAKTNAQVAYDNAVLQLSSASASLTQAQSVAIQIPTAQANLASAETALTKAQERLTKANKAAEDLNADIKSKQAALTSAKATLEAAKSALANAQAENSVAQEAKAAAQTAYDNAVSNLSSVSATLTQSQSVAIQTPTAKANLASAQATLKQAQENLVKAQKAVDDLSADIKVKQANLASAKQVLSTKQATLATNQATLTTEQNRLASLQNSLATTQANVLKAKENVITAKDNLVKAQTYLTSLQNAPELLAQAQQQEATAKANLLAALDTLEAELLKLKDLQVKQAAAQAVYDTTSKAYQTMLDAQEKQRLQDEYDAIIAQGKTPVAIVDETGKIVSYQAEDSQTTIQSSSVESTSVKAQIKPVEEVSVVTASALPMTGEHGSVLAVLFGCLMTIWGLVGVRKQKQ